jgi:hypothetical protein
MTDDQALIECIRKHKGEGPHSESSLLVWIANWENAKRLRAMGLIPVNPKRCVLDDDYSWKFAHRP